MSTSDPQRQGFIFGISAYIMWGLAPLYFKLLDDLPAVEILVQRIIWSFVLLVIIIATIKKWSNVRALFKYPKTMLILLGTSCLLSTNWGIFIWAVTNDRILDASLGYYINPLLSMALGAIFLQERLRRWQMVAVGLALSGVLIQVLSFGSVPWVSLSMAFTFGFYGLIRKKMTVDSLTGLLFESALMLPFAILYWLLVADSFAVNMNVNSWQLNLAMIGTSLVTTLPLLCFTAAARRLPYSIIGFLQYIGPSFMFVLAVFIYDEPITEGRWVTFGFIWLALMLFTWDTLSSRRQQKKVQDSRG